MKTPPTPSPTSYVDYVAELERRIRSDEALRVAVGGEFVAIGRLEYHLLRSLGLRDGDLVVDVGCGSGRLACQLAAFPEIRYRGCDVVPRLLEHARMLCRRLDWAFLHTDGATIPCPDHQADFACFFSVFTHLPHEQSYRYFREAHRVLKPGGLLVLSFLEFLAPNHWSLFLESVDGTRDHSCASVFLSRDAIQTWARHAGFEVRSLHDGSTHFIPLPEEIRFESGASSRELGSLGQSVAVLQKRPTETSAPSRELAAPLRAPAAAPIRPPTAPLLNVSARAELAAHGRVDVGFVIGGEVPRRVLVRAIGPGLRRFGVSHPLARPSLTLHAAGVPISGPHRGPIGLEAAALAEQAGAFALAMDSADAATIAVLPPGAYSAVVTAVPPSDSGQVLVEVYLMG